MAAGSLPLEEHTYCVCVQNVRWVRACVCVCFTFHISFWIRIRYRLIFRRIYNPHRMVIILSSCVPSAGAGMPLCDLFHVNKLHRFNDI